MKGDTLGVPLLSLLVFTSFIVSFKQASEKKGKEEKEKEKKEKEEKEMNDEEVENCSAHGSMMSTEGECHGNPQICSFAHTPPAHFASPVRSLMLVVSAVFRVGSITRTEDA